MKFQNKILLICIISMFMGCKTEPKEQESNIAYQESDHSSSSGVANYTKQDDWSKNASIYEVNIRQFSQEGTFDAVTSQLERIKKLGTDIIWLMPVHPISEAKRKEKPGDLGSYYAVGDFRAVNPEYGTMEDMEELIAEAHRLNMKVILDWVPNHTGWDHPWITEHPDYYTQIDGEIVDPINPSTGESWGWTDVADLNYDNQEMRKAMIDDMAFWITEKGIDGFRCDVAHGVPVDFWEESVPELRNAAGNKDLFFLAEAEKPELAGLFNMSYAWGFHHMLHQVLKGERPFSAIQEDINHYEEQFGKNHYAMMFTTNHDENSWSGTVFERYGDAHKAMAVLTFTIDGMPLVYSGQESAMDKQLKFFSKDAIDWKDYPLQDFYAELLQLKKENEALWNGEFGGGLEVFEGKEESKVYTYKREKNGNQVLVAINFSDEQQAFTFPFDDQEGWSVALGATMSTGSENSLSPHGYAVWVKNE